MSYRLLVTSLAAVVPALVSGATSAGIEGALARSEQLIVVTAPDWSSNRAVLALFERAADARWTKVSPDVPVMLGRNGLAWGVGLHRQSATKREGDGRSPAGVFELERIYGRDRQAPSSQFAYQQLSATMEGIDDPQSRYYNRLVDAARVRDRDWKSSERVRPANPMFRWCVEVRHNWQQRAALGSCIYLHIWKAPGVPTSGCTAMSKAALDRVVRWLDARKRPLLVQLPEAELALVRVHLTGRAESKAIAETR
jgi:L,D-peptidoglycan transpeptidase YkuD (ErfK/YbiS/YcfS/YnhG family)